MPGACSSRRLENNLENYRQHLQKYYIHTNTIWTDGRTGGVAISPVPGPTARREIKTLSNSCNGFICSCRHLLYVDGVSKCVVWWADPCLRCSQLESFRITRIVVADTGEPLIG